MDLLSYARFGQAVARKRIAEEAQRRGLGSEYLHVCEFPRSGGTWISSMIRDTLHSALDSSGPERTVFHSHQRHSSHLRPAVYVVRDGRDVMVSLYFHHVRHLEAGTPILGRRVARYFEKVLGPGYDAHDVRANLPPFVDSLAGWPLGGIQASRDARRFLPWPDHVRDWISREGIVATRYEDFSRDAASELSSIAEYLEVDVSAKRLAEIVHDNSFAAVTGRQPGVEHRDSFHRKGVVGDWKNHFTSEAGRAFNDLAGNVLVEIGYEEDKSWLDELVD